MFLLKCLRNFLPVVSTSHYKLDLLIPGNYISNGSDVFYEVAVLKNLPNFTKRSCI